MSDFLSELEDAISAPEPRKGSAYKRHQKMVEREARKLAKKKERQIRKEANRKAEKKQRRRDIDKMDDLTRAQFEALTPEQQEQLIETARMTPKQLKLAKKKKSFLIHLRSLGNETKAARKAGFKYGKAAIDRMRKSDPLFDLNCRIAQQEAIAELESEARRRAIHGVEEYVTYRGEVSYLRDAYGVIVLDPITGEPVPLKVRKYSDRLLELLLKRFDPAYRDKEPVQQATQGGVLLINNTQINNTTNNSVSWEEKAQSHEQDMDKAREKLKSLIPETSGLPVIDANPLPVLEAKEPQKITTGRSHV